MAQFKDLSSLEKYLTQVIGEISSNSMDLEDKMSETMREAVIDIVYNAYSPTQYKRRGDDGGLSDTDNMIITSADMRNGKVLLTFENITSGVDTLAGKRLDETINDGIKGNWANPNGSWSEPRPFIEETRERLQQKSGELARELEKELKRAGFKTR